MITAERLREMLDYDPSTGEFSWKKRPRQRQIQGSAGGKAGRYVYIGLGQKSYLAHRLAWFFHFGKWPNKHLDHINGNGRDNRIANLREATMSDNLCNQKRRADNTTGFKGVFPKRSKFSAQIRKGSTRLCLGTFNTAEEAHAAYCEASRKLHGEYSRV